MIRDASLAMRVAALGCVLMVAAGGCKTREQSAESPAGGTAAPAAQTPMARGQYLVTILGCNDCHTPFKLGPHGPEPDMTRMLSGHPAEMVMPPPPDLSGQPWQWVGAATNTAFSGPWGITYAANITSDTVTGIGSWTEAQFMEVMRNGKIFGGQRPIMPPMPWPAYRHLVDEDLKAVYAFLQSSPPLTNQVPPYAPPAGAPGMAAPGGGAPPGH